VVLFAGDVGLNTYSTNLLSLQSAQLALVVWTLGEYNDELATTSWTSRGISQPLIQCPYTINSRHITGWKIGYVVGPAALMAEFRKVHQFNVFTVHTPSQLALAEYMQDASRHLGLAAFYQEKRDFFRELMAGTPFELLPCRGTYFQLAAYKAISDLPDRAFAEWMTREVGVAVIPVSVFNADGRDDHVVRFCFAKKEETLVAAGERLRRL
jgi:aspartate/methionine/tyrosine aminotransferase